jgi:FlaA1/EpsC-like NDP-sugar epimerase
MNSRPMTVLVVGATGSIGQLLGSTPLESNERFNPVVVA